MAAVELATAYVSLTVDASQISKSIGKGFATGDKIAAASGKRMGKALAKGVEESSDVDLEGLRAEVETAEKRVTAAIEQGSQQQAKARRAVQLAEAELQEKRDSGRAKASQLMRAEDKLTLAKQKLEAATMAATSDQAKFTAELDQTRAALRDAETAAESTAQGTRTAFSGVGDFIKKSLSGDFAGAFQGLEGDASKAAGQVEGEFSSVGDDAGQGFSEGFVSKIKGIGGVVAGLGIGLSLTEGLMTGMDNARLNDRLAAQLALTGPQAKQAGQIAGSLYAGAYGESMEDVNAAVAAVMSSLPGMMDAPAASIESTTAKALDLASAFDVDVNESVGAIGVMMRNGLATDADQAFDLMVGAMQKVPAGFRDELFPAITEYGKHFAGLGIDGATAMGLLVRGAENGVIGVDKMGDAVKEFQIRSTDMSKATGEAYDAIGLDMQTMTNELLAGGPRAEEAFAQIIHGLQGMEDPAAQSAAALALFGTPLEDLSVNEIPNFLGMMDPAGDAFDDFSGAAERMGDTLNNNAATAIESIKRTVGQGFSNIIGTAAVAVVGLAEAFAPVVGFLRDTMPHWGPFAAGIGLVATAYGVWTAATWLQTTALWGQAAAWIAANAGLIAIIAGLGLVVGTVIYAWNHFDWFRNGVLAVWSGIQSVVARFVAWFQATAVPWIRTALQVAGQWFSWLHTNVITPVWNGIVSVIRGAWNGFIKPVFDALVGFVRTIIAPTLTWLWNNVVRPAFSGIASAVSYAWTTTIQPTLKALWAFIRDVVAPIIGWLWKNIVAPAFKGIGSIIQFVWSNTIKVVFAAIEWFLKNILGPVFRWLWYNVVVPVWDGISSKIKWAWDNVISPVFGRLRDGVDRVKLGFERAQEGISTAWDRIRKAVAEPVNAVITKVVNPFIGGYNRLNDFWSGDDLNPLAEIKGYHAGGWTGPGAKYQEAGIVHADEFVIRKESQRDISRTAPGLLDAMNRYGSAALGYASGGLVGPQMAGPGTPVYGSLRSFSNPLQQIVKSFGQLYVRPGGFISPQWQLNQAAKMWDNVAGVKVGVAPTGMPAVHARQGSDSPIGGQGWAGVYWGNQIRLHPSMLGRMNSRGLRTVAAHEIGHALGLPHAHEGNGARSIMNYSTMYSAGAPTSADVRALQAIYPGGTGKVNVEDGDTTGIGGWIVEKLKALVTAPIDAAKQAFAGNKFVQMPLGIADKLVEGVIDKAASLAGIGGSGGEGQVTEWMTQALKMKGLYSEANLASGVRRAMQESGGDPSAINNWDINAINGDPSRGLMQVIGATFRQYMEPGFDNIMAPLDNILASINYTIARYGSLKAGWDRPGGYADGGLVTPMLHDNGGYLQPGLTLVNNATGKPEPVLNPAQWDAAEAALNGTSTGPGVVLQVENMFGTPKGIVDELERRQRRANHAAGIRRIGKVSIG